MPLFLEQFPTQTAARESQDFGQEEKARNSTCTWKKPEENKQFARKPSCKSRSAATNTQSHGIICKSLINNGMASERQKLDSQMEYKLMWCHQLRWVQFTVFILPKKKLVPSLCYYLVIMTGEFITRVSVKGSVRKGVYVTAILLTRYYSRKHLTLLYHLLFSASTQS